MILYMQTKLVFWTTHNKDTRTYFLMYALLTNCTITSGALYGNLPCVLWTMAGVVLFLYNTFVGFFSDR